MTPYTLAFRNTPVVLRRIVGAIDPERVRSALAEGRFSLVEMVAHLADSELVFVERLSAAVERDVPVFGRVDVEARAVEMRFAEADLEDRLDRFTERREKTIALLEALAPEAWAREMEVPIGRVSIEGYAAFIAGHDHYHLEQASAYLKG